MKNPELAGGGVERGVVKGKHTMAAVTDQHVRV